MASSLERTTVPMEDKPKRAKGPSLKRKAGEEELRVENKKAKEEDGMRIPITGRAGIVEEAICSSEDYNEVNKYTWNMNNGGYAAARMGSGVAQSMHRLVMGLHGVEIPRGCMVDHINRCKLDNRFCNLRITTASQNSQNKDKKKGTTSRYIGVFRYHWAGITTWNAKCGRQFLGRFVSEEAAAWAYDQAATAAYGAGARINGVERPLDPDEGRTKKAIRLNTNLGVRPRGNSWVASATIKGRSVRLGSFKSADDAAAAALKARADEAMRKELDAVTRPIEYNAQGVAVIRTKKGDEILVDADRWHELMRSRWSIGKTGYAKSYVKTRGDILMHRLIIGENDSSVLVDHINHVRLDNRRCNLRRATASSNSHNRTKAAGTTSKFIGVSLDKNDGKWCVEIRVNNRKQHLGRYRDEIVAAFAYDQRATELYGEHANLNGIAQPQGWEYSSKAKRCIKILSEE